MTFEPGTPAPEVVADDHLFAAWLAEAAGRRLLEVRGEGLEGKELKDAGDRAAHVLLMDLLAIHRPDDAVLSEERPDEGADKVDRLSASRVWIVDPLDGTREFSEPPRDDWAVHVAVWQGGTLTAGAVARAAGLFTSRVDGSELIYNQADVYLPDVIVCRPELADDILAFIAEHGTES